MALEFGTGIWAFGQFVDRYAADGYGPPRGTRDMIEMAARVPNLACLDINVPFATEGMAAAEVRQLLDDNGLTCRAATPHIYMREYMKGSFTNPSSDLRRRTQARVEEAVEAAQVLGAGYVKFWPGQDGYDFPGQVDYMQIWDYTIDGMREISRLKYQNSANLLLRLGVGAVRHRHLTVLPAQRGRRIRPLKPLTARKVTALAEEVIVGEALIHHGVAFTL